LRSSFATLLSGLSAITVPSPVHQVLSDSGRRRRPCHLPGKPSPTMADPSALCSSSPSQSRFLVGPVVSPAIPSHSPKDESSLRACVLDLSLLPSSPTPSRPSRPPPALLPCPQPLLHAPLALTLPSLLRSSLGPSYACTLPARFHKESITHAFSSASCKRQDVA
jgi:hypothetical protein